MAMRHTLPILLALATVAPTPSAWADCEDGVAALTSIMARVTDAHARAVLTADLAQAETDLWELDEVECAMALTHAQRFLQRQAGAAQ